MSDYTHLNLKDDVDDQAPNFDLAPELEFRMARVPLEMENAGVSYLRIAPGFRIPFGHKHITQEEVYVILRGSARISVEDEIVELGEMDAIRFDRDTMRAVEAGPDGVEYLAFGAGDDPLEVESAPGWWAE